MSHRRPATPAAIPRLASDTRRSWVAVTIAFVVVFGASIVVALFDPDDQGWLDSIVLGFLNWFLFGVVYLWLTARTFGGTDAATLARWLEASTPRTPSSRFWEWLSGGSGRSWATQGAVVAVATVLVLAFSAESRSSLPLMISAIAAVAGSWLMILGAFTMQYARSNTEEQGLAFPGDTAPVFADYCYLAVQVSTTFSSSDVSIESRELRRLVTWHSLIAFAFNTIIVAILVSALLAA